MALKHKHLVLEQDLIEKAKDYLGVSTDTDAIASSLKLIAEEADINDFLKKTKGKAKIEKALPIFILFYFIPDASPITNLLP